MDDGFCLFEEIKERTVQHTKFNDTREIYNLIKRQSRKKVFIRPKHATCRK